MVNTYRILAMTIAVLVGVQAASHAWASAGIGAYVTGGGVIDASLMEGDGPMPFVEIIGFIVHGVNGGIAIPAVALALLVVSFFTKVPGALKWAGIVLGLVAVQMTLGYSARELALLALFHGLNALLLFAAALVAWRTPKRATAAGATTATKVGTVGV